VLKEMFCPLETSCVGGLVIPARCDPALGVLSVLVTVRALDLVLAVIRRIRKTAKSDYLLRRVSLSVLLFRMEQLGSDWTDFHEI
jgi:hypothetical protein